MAENDLQHLPCEGDEKSVMKLKICEPTKFKNSSHTVEEFQVLQTFRKEVVKYDEFLSLSHEEVIQLIACSDLTVSFEENVFESGMNWAKYELSCREQFLPDLMEHVRLPLISKPYLLDNVVEEPLLKNSKDYVFEAIHFHLLKIEKKMTVPKTIRCKPRCLQKQRTYATLHLQEGIYISNLALIADQFVITIGHIPIIPPTSSKFDQFNQMLDLFSQKSSWVLMTNMSVHRFNFAVGVLNNNLYVVGGYKNSKENLLGSVECYNPGLDTWTPVAKMSKRRSYMGIGVIDGIMYAVGGTSGLNTCCTSVEAFRPSVGVWTPVADMHLGILPRAVEVIDGLLYVMGNTNSSNMLTIQIYNPNTNTWKLIKSLTDVVIMLLETPFRRWNSDSKNDLLKMGKPIPILSALAPDKKLNEVFCRSFNPNLYQQHSWLCWVSLNTKIVLLGKIKSVWNTVGYYDLKKLSRGIQIHQTSKEHIHNHLGLKNLEKNCFTILYVVNEHGNLFKKNYNENMRLNRLFIEHLIDLVLFLGKQELAFRGHDESSDSLNKGNFRELFEMHIIRCSQEIQNHYNSIKNIFSGMSKSIQNDLISCISEFLINQIKNEIKQCKFYSIQIDNTTDISQKTQCSIIIRYVTDKSELIERFLGFHNVSEDRTAQGLFNLVNSVLYEFDIENKLVGQCYDGACVMSGHLTGLQARVKEVEPNALFTHCLAHRLNLVLQHGCSINAKCRIFFANLTGIAAYFHNSTLHTNFVDTIVGKRIPQFVQTRWSSRSKILHTIVNEWSGFIDVFDCISKDPKSSSESICGAIGHFKNLKTFEFAFLALIFSDIFIYIDNLFNILQNKSFDVEFCLRKINITYDLINKKRNEPEFLKLFNQAVTLTKPPKATRNESNNQSNFKILFYEIIDNILMQLNTRFQDTNKLLFL
ncbi:hypothetical protein QTP88_027314 [Uroleucon formosanum]